MDVRSGHVGLPQLKVTSTTFPTIPPTDEITCITFYSSWRNMHDRTPNLNFMPRRWLTRPPLPLTRHPSGPQSLTTNMDLVVILPPKHPQAPGVAVLSAERPLRYFCQNHHRANVFLRTLDTFSTNENRPYPSNPNKLFYSLRPRRTSF